MPTTKTKPAKKPKASKKPKKPSAEARAKALDEKLGELGEAMQAHSEAVSEWEEQHASAAAAKKLAEKRQTEINAINRELMAIRSGTWQPSLPFTGLVGDAAKTDPTIDEGAALPLSALTEFGMTEAQVEALLTGTTFRNVGDLETGMRADAYWHTKIPGFGEAKVDKLLDAHVKLRAKYPWVAVASDHGAPKSNGEHVAAPTETSGAAK